MLTGKRKNNMKTKVIFRMMQGEVLALFPQDCGTNDPYTCLSYAHNGQHGSADPVECIRASRPATPAEYASLKRELENYGPPEAHYSLDTRKRHTQADLAARRAQLNNR